MRVRHTSLVLTVVQKRASHGGVGLFSKRERDEGTADGLVGREFCRCLE